ncbi:2-keto-4-pentenoate hydratase [Mesohalobacter halotolerans]|uniref:2-keto-4-pentenoate hydratase n=1 Tax=Mesohalobacter halotolerans TaxID=1883405 RepID=A0A4U5TNK2_9FLAO|nr:fumarylacetoacetate hydrolase family protein [Mesohalobacter halotolerans]MBS3737616.1 fumarylacetoacetate hydrolase family protein [Psychroflexus sp.]TKS55446.1 2-keto-4-pentenoate hydratase [Mesohalobacter halotolerans]
MNSIEQIAEEIYKAETEKQPIAPIRTFFKGGRNIEAAYEIQQLVTQKKIAKGAQLVGKKIGLTSFAVQKQLGVDEPDFGILTDDMQIKNHSKISFSQLMQPKAEAEWAFVLKENLDADMITLNDVKNAIDYAVVAIEVVGSRIKNWDIKITDTIADNASASHFVLGSKKIDLSKIDLVNCKMQMFKNDSLVSEGNGQACMGNPLNAVQWLAKTMQKNNQPLKVGEIILSGALGPMIEIKKGDNLSAQIDNFDKVKFKVV